MIAPQKNERPGKDCHPAEPRSATILTKGKIMNSLDSNTTAVPGATATTWATIRDLAKQLSTALAEVDNGTWCAYIAPAADGKTHVALGLLGDDGDPLETIRRMRKGVPA